SLLFRKGGNKLINPKGKKILFVGDSHTAYTKQPIRINPTQINGEGWASYLARIYGFTEINISVGGRASKYLMDKFLTYLETNAKPDVAFFYVGANDAFSPVSNKQAIKNIQFMIDTCNKKGITPVVITGYNSRKVIVNNPRLKGFTNVYGTFTQKNLWDMGENRYQQQLMFSELKNAIVVPMFNDVLPSDAADGLHLGLAKQQQLAKFIAPYVFA
ncbi:MAG: SGNH/GDSL hydrolase family protein, partial [Pseudomonadota bacterium]